MEIRELKDEDSQTIKDLMAHHWGGEPLIIRGQEIFASKLPGIMAFDRGVLVGFLIYDLDSIRSEIIAFEVFEKFRGIGTKLLDKLFEITQKAGTNQVFLTTQNDNIDALRFYQKRGFIIDGIHKNTMVDARKRKPTIREFGDYGIPVRDEIDLVLSLK